MTGIQVTIDTSLFVGATDTVLVKSCPCRRVVERVKGGASQKGEQPGPHVQTSHCLDLSIEQLELSEENKSIKSF